MPKVNLHSSAHWHMNSRPTAVYRLYSSDDRLLYVGITVNPKVRFRDHKAQKPWWHEVTRKVVEWYDTRPEAEAIEGAALRDERPLYDKTHRMGAGWRSSSLGSTVPLARHSETQRAVLPDDVDQR